MASIRNRGKNKWQVIIELGTDEKGKRQRIYREVNGLRKDAEKVANELEYKLQKGRLIKTHRQQVGSYLIEWLHHKSRELRPGTVESYRTNIERHLAPFFKKLYLQQLRPHHIEDYKNYKLEKGRLDGKGGLSPRTVQYHLTLLSEALSHAVRLQIIPWNPCNNVVFPSAGTPELNILSPEGVSKLLQASEGSKYQELIVTAINTGARKGELLGLQWDRVDLQNQEISIEKTLERQQGQGLSLAPVKTRKSKRRVSVSSDLITIFKNIKKRQAEYKLLLGDKYDNRGFVFCHEDGGPFEPSWVSKKLKAIAKKAGFSQLRFHDLRHIHVSILLAQGADPKTIQERVGHASISTLLDIYAHTFPTSQKEIVDLVSGAIKQCSQNVVKTQKD